MTFAFGTEEKENRFISVKLLCMQSNTAILFFSRTAEAEASQKSILVGQRNNLALIKRMIGRTQGLMRRSGLDYYEVTENEQVGTTFGERLSAATESVFQRGYDQLIILGNDCPQLRLADIQRAAQALKNGGNVLGRDQRGGAYLIGLQRNSFSAASFQALPWQQLDLQKELAAYLGSKESTALLIGSATLKSPALKATELRVLADLTTWADLCRIWRFLVVDGTFLTFLQLIKGAQLVERERNAILKLSTYIKQFAHRGPPVLG